MNRAMTKIKHTAPSRSFGGARHPHNYNKANSMLRRTIDASWRAAPARCTNLAGGSDH